MMNQDRTTPDDALLVRYLDGEATADERAHVDAAVAAGNGTARRLAQLEQRSARLRALLDASDIEVPASLSRQPTVQDVSTTASHENDGGRAENAAVSSENRDLIPMRVRAHKPVWLQPWARAAAIVLVVIATAMVVPPLRAWIFDGVQRIVDRDRDEIVEAPPSSDDIETTRIFLDDVTDVFTIRLTAEQSTGQLTVRVANVAQGTAELRTPRGGTESLLVLPDGVLEIANSAGSTAEYDVTLPRSVREVHVRIGNTEVVFRTAEVQERVFPLGR